MNIHDLNKIGKGLQDVLHLKTIPLGMKFFEDASDIPSSFERIERRKVICNVIGFSRYYEIPVAITREHTANLCPVATISLGFGSAPEDFAERAVGAFACSAEQAAQIVKGMKSLGQGRYAAVGVCPLDRMPLLPDVVQVWGNPTQMLELEYANTWNNAGRPIEMISNGHGASCYEALTWPVVEDKIRMAIADMGDKRHGYAGDDEMILGVPLSRLEQLYEGLLATMKTLNKLPVLYNFDDLNFPIPKYALEHSPALKKR